MATLVDSFYCYNSCYKMVINLAPVSLTNKKVNFYTCPRLSFLKKNATENAYKSISEPLDFKIFWGGMPPHPLAAGAFSIRNLPRLVLKSGYGPDYSNHKRTFCEIFDCIICCLKLVTSSSDIR